MTTQTGRILNRRADQLESAGIVPFDNGPAVLVGSSLRESSMESFGALGTLQPSGPYCDDGPGGHATSCEVITDPDLIMEIANLIDNKLATCGGIWEGIADRLKYDILYMFNMVKFTPAGSKGGYWLGHPDGSATIGITENVFDGASISNEFIFREILGHESLHDYLWDPDAEHSNSIWQTNNCLAY